MRERNCGSAKLLAALVQAMPVTNIWYKYSQLSSNTISCSMFRVKAQRACV